MPSNLNLLVTFFTVAVFVELGASARAEPPQDGALVQYGKMHEAIGKHQDQGRVQLSDLVKQPHFFAVGALQGLEGEVTIADGKVTITGVDADGQMKPMKPSEGQQATMLVGAYVPDWTSHKAPQTIAPDKFDDFIADSASAAGVNTDKPFLFSVEGEFHDVRLHVIHGACPIHARMQKLELPQSERPYEGTLSKVRGRLIGVYAKDAVGSLTHPATSTHLHILFENQKTGAQVTAHVERIGLQEGATLMLPKK